MKRNVFLGGVLGGVAGALAVLAIVALFSLKQVIAFADAHDGLAGWAQAFGSIAAIWVAARLVNLEGLNRDVAGMEAFRGVVMAIDQIMEDATAGAEDSFLGGTSIQKLEMKRFTEARALLDNTPTFELGSTKAAGLLMQMKIGLYLMRGAVVNAVTALPGAQIDAVKVRTLRQDSAARLALVSTYVEDRRRRARQWLWPTLSS